MPLNDAFASVAAQIIPVFVLGAVVEVAVQYRSYHDSFVALNIPYEEYKKRLEKIGSLPFQEAGAEFRAYDQFAEASEEGIADKNRQRAVARRTASLWIFLITTLWATWAELTCVAKIAGYRLPLESNLTVFSAIACSMLVLVVIPVLSSLGQMFLEPVVALKRAREIRVLQRRATQSMLAKGDELTRKLGQAVRDAEALLTDAVNRSDHDSRRTGSSRTPREGPSGDPLRGQPRGNG